MFRASISVAVITRPHTEEEYVVKEDMLNALDFVDSIIENCTEVYPHQAKERDYIDYGGSRYYGVSYGSYRRSKKRKFKQRGR